MKQLITTALIAAGALILVGCQMPGKVVETRQSLVCPTCTSITRTSPIKGIQYDTMACPKCQTTTTGTWKYEQDYQQTVHYCSTCETKVSACPVCAAER